MNKKILSLVLALSLIGSSYTGNVPDQKVALKRTLKIATAAAEKEHPQWGFFHASLFLTAAAPVVGLGSSFALYSLYEKFSFAPNRRALTDGIAMFTLPPLVIAAYTGLMLYRENQKKRMIVKQLVKQYAEHQDELNDDQIVVLAEHIATWNENKSLNITNPQEILAQLQALV